MVVVRTFDGHIEPLCLAKPDDWYDFIWVLSDALDMALFKLRTFSFFQQTGKSRDKDREPIGGGGHLLALDRARLDHHGRAAGSAAQRLHGRGI